MRPLKIVATGKHLPRRVVRGEELDRLIGAAPGATEHASGVAERRYAGDDERASRMGALALMDALERARLRYEDLDAIVCASGTMEQPIPCTAALIQRELGKGDSGTPCFDINSTCLSFVTALDLVASLIEAGRYGRVAIVSTEIASVGLNPRQLEAASLFGDGAAAAVVERTPAGDLSGVITARMETYASAWKTCMIEGGGTGLDPHRHYSPENADRFRFAMDGRKVFRAVLERLPGFLERALAPAGLRVEEFALVIPHQASGSGMELMRRNLGIAPERWMNILATHGNMIAASIPLALHCAIEQGRLRRGDRALLVGTSAGLSLGAVAIEF
jgi:3-oxoacyl-[acyl-carrier-protein] synthase-3